MPFVKLTTVNLKTIIIRKNDIKSIIDAGTCGYGSYSRLKLNSGESYDVVGTSNYIYDLLLNEE